MKLAKACKSCRIGKRRCITAQGQTSCTQCIRRDHDCSFAAAIRSSTPAKQILPAPTQGYLNHQSSLRLSLDLTPQHTRELVDTYFRLIHDKPHTLFHEPTFWKQYEDRTLDDPVLLGVLALAVRVCEPRPSDALIESIGDRAKMALKIDIDNVSIANTQACILIGNVYAAEGNHEAESLFFGIGFTMAHVLRLQEPTLDGDDIMREIRSRVWCSLYMIDCWSSSGNNMPRRLTDQSMPAFPMDEVDLANMVGQSGPVTGDTVRPGMWGFMVQLAKIFSDIQDLHRQLADGAIDYPKAQEITDSLAQSFTAFDESLPIYFRLSPENVRRHASNGVGSTFVALHLGYHYYSVLLYFPYLDRRLEHTPTMFEFAARCKAHAAEFSDLLRLSRELEGCRAVYFIVAHMAVVSSATLLHTLLFGDENELVMTRRRLEANFVALIDLRDKWPAVKPLMSRLFTFQRSCMWEADGNTHKVDSWMVMFLLNHGLPLSEKTQTGQSPESWDATMSAEVVERGKVATNTLAMLTQPSETGIVES